MNPNDEIRAQILDYFYERNANASSRLGKSGSAVKISDVKRELKLRFGLKPNQIMSNLTYLIDQGWIKTFPIEKTIRTKSGTLPSTVTWYEVTAAGIDKIEGDSEFMPNERYAGININATGENVITLGDGNWVNVRHKDLHMELDRIKGAVAAADELSDLEKLNVSVDIESLKDQLAKTEPDGFIVGRLWSAVEAIVTGAGLINVLKNASRLIAPLCLQDAHA